jgi:hypothetical protein
MVSRFSERSHAIPRRNRQGDQPCRTLALKISAVFSRLGLPLHGAWRLRRSGNWIKVAPSELVVLHSTLRGNQRRDDYGLSPHWDE